MLYKLESQNSNFLNRIPRHRYSSVYGTFYVDEGEFWNGSSGVLNSVLGVIARKLTEYIIDIANGDDLEVKCNCFKPNIRLHAAFIDPMNGTSTIGPMTVNVNRIYEALCIMEEEASLLQRKEDFLMGRSIYLFR